MIRSQNSGNSILSASDSLPKIHFFFRRSHSSDLTRQINSANAELLAAASQNEETRRQSESNIAAMEQEKIILSAQVQDLKIAVADVEANKLKVCAQNEDTVVALEKEKAELAAEIR